MSQAEYSEKSEQTEPASEPEDSDDKKEAKKSHKPDLKEGQWWRAKELERKPHEILDTVVKQIEDDQQGRYEAYREYERLFGSSVGHNGDDSYRSIASDELIQNELRNTLESLWAQIFKNRVVPGVSASEEDWDEWDRARSYSRWLEGAFDDSLVYEECFPQAGIHMLTHGTGIIRVGWECVDEDTAKVISWAVNPRYVLVDRMEGKHGKPRSIYFKDHIDRYKLFDTYGQDTEDGDDYGFYGTAEERRTGINKVTGNDDIDSGVSNSSKCDMITVREAYHLKSGHNSDDGRHVIWINGCTLVDEPFNWDRLPAVFMRYSCRMEGFWGESAVRLLAPTQKLLDKLNVKIDSSQDVVGVTRILLGNGGKGLKVQHFDDVPGGVLVMDGPVDQVRDWNAISAPPDIYQDRDKAPSKMRGLIGMSDFETSAQLPAGLRDVGAPFMEHYVEQGAARHAMDHAEYENGVVSLSYLYMLQAEDCQAMGYDIVVKSNAEGSKTSIETLSFKDVHIDRKRLKVRVQPMSQLPQSFAGKIESFGKIKDAGGQIDNKTMMRMLEVPDLAGATDMLVSDEDIIMKNLSHMTRTGEYLAPMPFDNLDLIVQLTTRYINKYRVRQGRDFSKIALLAQYIDDASQLKAGVGGNPNAPPSVSAALGMPGMGMPGMPQGPMAPGMPPAGPMGAGMPPGGPMVPPPAQAMAGGPPLVMSPPPQMQVGPQG